MNLGAALIVGAALILGAAVILGAAMNPSTVQILVGVFILDAALNFGSELILG